MRSYGQHCGLAKTLDVIGDRWSLLIVRELLLRDGCRYTDLLQGLPGISTNLLVDRLRDLERAGVVARDEAPPPVATTLYRLTARGKELRPAVLALGRWGAPLLAKGSDDEAFRSHWMALPVEIVFADHAPKGPPMAIELRTGDEPVVIEAADGAIHTRPGTAEDPDGVLTGPPRLVVGVLVGKLTLEDARARGLEYEGDPEALDRLLPHSAAPAA